MQVLINCAMKIKVEEKINFRTKNFIERRTLQGSIRRLAGLNLGLLILH